jgi:hypothetical protein
MLEPTILMIMFLGAGGDLQRLDSVRYDTHIACLNERDEMIVSYKTEHLRVKCTDATSGLPVFRISDQGVPQP